MVQDARAGTTSTELRAKYRLHRSDLFMILERDPTARQRMEEVDCLSSRDSHRQKALDYLVEHNHLQPDDLASFLGKKFGLVKGYDLGLAIGSRRPRLQVFAGKIRSRRSLHRIKRTVKRGHFEI